MFGPMATPIEAAHGLLDAAIDNFRDPAYRVEFFAAAVAMVPFARARLPFIPAMVLSIAAGKAARWAYESAEEVKAKLGDSNAPGRI